MIKLGIVMDPISDINIKKDSSFAMLMAAQSRGYQLYYMEMQDLAMVNGKAMGNMRPLKVINDAAKWFELGEAVDTPLAELDTILMRKDPPFDTEFIYATYMLERAEEEGVLIVNKPQSLRDANEKLFTAWFSEFTPETVVTRDAKRIRAFHQLKGDVIIKPLDGMGGSSIFRIKQDDPNIGVIIETLTNHGKQYAMAQAFIPEITQGDKRILVVDGEPVPYSLARIPMKGETRGNLAAGGSGVAQALSESDWKIARAIGPELKKRGLIFVGLDVIGDKLTEINVTSPTCIREIEAAFDVDITGMLMDAIEARIKATQ
ncbi:glutathione synthase [Shewanella aestuarii]|uniref:Glutathione synthetase n=1 Tax=Shewanella aestuarii TaxID=1028752 RepID=A0A6G9QGJ6_9GAMM|nr:glutathione synthase [Shewanella aestuarii]QIR13596.1 glutathione synthase [Shewanella aestuarii]